MTQYKLPIFLFILLSLGVLAATGVVDCSSPLPKTVLKKAHQANSAQLLPASPEVRKEKLRQILSRREFGVSQQGLLERVTGWIIEKISNAVKWMLGSGQIGNGLSQVLSVILASAIIVLFIALIAFVLARIGAAGIASRTAAGMNDLYEGPKTPKAALSEAARLASEGDYRSALRLVYLAILLKLDDRELIRFDRTGTNWEYLAKLRPYSELQEILRPVTIAFDEKWYGHAPASDEDYREFLDIYHNVESYEAAG